MMITLLDTNNKPVAINSDHILTITNDPLHEDGTIINMINGKSIMIPHMSIEEITAKINKDTNNRSDLSKMTDALCGRIQHLEERVEAGLQYIGRSCH